MDKDTSSSTSTATTNGRDGPFATTAAPQAPDLREDDETAGISPLSTLALEQKLKTLRDQSNQHSAALTQRLATSQSGQNLLHIGSSLSTLPPDLHALLQQLHPILSEAESLEQDHVGLLTKWVGLGNEIRADQRRVVHAQECQEYLEDLDAAERNVVRVLRHQKKATGLSVEEGERQQQDEEDERMEELDNVASLERAAHTTLCLVQELHLSSEHVSILTTSRTTSNLNAGKETLMPSLRTPLEQDSERAQFIMKLAPRIRRLEADCSACLIANLEKLLKRLQQVQRLKQEQASSSLDEDDTLKTDHDYDSSSSLLTIMIGHCLRGLALLGKGKEAENVFARVAIMPLISSTLSMGRLDEGGSRGACSGLRSLLEEITESISKTFGPVLQISECTFSDMDDDDDNNNKAIAKVEVDLCTAGVWVPLATALLADPGIKMAIFSPGIASILQANYTALHTFLSELAVRLLGDTSSSSSEQQVTPQCILRAQTRIYSHPKTAEFSKRWNLPIYYQLRFGDYCSRLNAAVDKTRLEGWHADNVYSNADLEQQRRDTGLELGLFVELYDILGDLWAPEVFLRPLTHRFLRGSIQLVTRSLSFVKDGLDKKITFGQEKKPTLSTPVANGDSGTQNGSSAHDDDVLGTQLDMTNTRDPYYWAESIQDVAAVAWDLTVLESKLTHEYTDLACAAIGDKDSDKDICSLLKESLTEASSQISPVVEHSWNGVICEALTKRCCGPLAAVKGVAATYRMTNRPPPTNPSPFVTTILRALREFDGEFKHRTPPSVGLGWKIKVVTTVAHRYSVAVQELIATVQRTEVALKNRKARRTAMGGMSDGEKVKLQLYLDYKAFAKQVQEVGVDPTTVDGLAKLRDLTKDAEKLSTAAGKSIRTRKTPTPPSSNGGIRSASIRK